MSDFNSFDELVNSDKFGHIKNESYMLLLGELKGIDSKTFKVFVPDRKTFIELLTLLKDDKYVVINVEAFNCKKAKKFIKELRDEDKPNGLNFGKEGL